MFSCVVTVGFCRLGHLYNLLMICCSLNDSALESEEGHQCAANQIKNMPDNVLIQESGKLIVIMDLLDQMKREGHRCLVFSQSRKMLDIIYQLINNRVSLRPMFREYKIFA